MKIVNAGYEILSKIDGLRMLKNIETIARTCYKSETAITSGSAMNLVKRLIASGHEAMLEHDHLSVKFIVDRGVSHELVRHRLASFAQESTRYCNYSKDKFDNEITFIKPLFFEEGSFAYATWFDACQKSEHAYLSLLENGAKPEEARTVLNNSLKTEICMTANLREWRHFFKLRAADLTGKAHPQMKEVTIPLLKELQEYIPLVFDDIIVAERTNMT